MEDRRGRGLVMSYRFREVRKGERDAVIAFAAEHGSAVSLDTLRHHLSLAVESDGDLLVAALCVEKRPGQFVLEIVVGTPAADQALLTELADRCLRKVQAQDIASARIQSQTGEPTEAICTQANWLDRVAETAPPAANPSEDESVEAA